MAASEYTKRGPHEQSIHQNQFRPEKVNGTTTLIGLFVPDVDAVMDSALAAGATLVSPAQDYDYGFRQGNIKDTFGHVWMIERKFKVPS